MNDVGLASLYATRGLNLPCLWVAICGRRDPQLPQHTHYDPEIGLAWNLKDQLPAAEEVFYAKLIRGRPTFVSWDLFPAVYRLFRPRRDYLADCCDGLMSPAAEAILDALHCKRPQETLELELATHLARPSHRRTFDSAIAELQRRLYVCMREARYEPFTYVWDPVQARYPERVWKAGHWRPSDAAANLVRRYVNAVIYASPNHVSAVVGTAKHAWDRSRPPRARRRRRDGRAQRRLARQMYCCQEAFLDSVVLHACPLPLNLQSRGPYGLEANRIYLRRRFSR